MKKIEELRAAMAEQHKLAKAIQDQADEEGRPCTEEEDRQIAEHIAEYDAIKAEIERRLQLEDIASELDEPQPRRVSADVFDGPDDEDAAADPAATEDENFVRVRPQAGSRRVRPAGTSARARPNAANDRRRHGFNSAGQFFMAVRAAARGQVDPRLTVRAAQTTYGGESVGEDGGFAVPPEFRQEITDLITGEDSLLSRCDQVRTQRNSITIPVDRHPVWSASGGFQAYWEDEADAAAASKPKLEDLDLKLKKLMALVPVSDELLEDAPLIESYIRRKVPEVMDYKISDAIVNGAGAGKPLGILKSSALITVTRQSGTTLVFDDISNMRARMYARCLSRAIWIVNQDLMPSLDNLKFPGDSSPVYLPGANIAGAPFGTLWGRPVLFHEVAAAGGSAGDIILADMMSYLTALKSTGLRTDVSMHVYFEQALMAFRFIFRIAGQPWWKKPVTPAKSANTRSCFVTLSA